jgi:ribosome-binding protein aMBF1 (putative translation factor)
LVPPYFSTAEGVKKCFGLAVREHRKELGLPVDELARRLGTAEELPKRFVD